MPENLYRSSLGGVIVLMYHRIDRTDTNPWSTCVSPLFFEQHLQFLSHNFQVLALNDAVEQLIKGETIKNGICLTFDDGYMDNYINAKPILEKYDCSATFFIPTAFAGRSKPFWWDELEVLLLHSKRLPAMLSLQINRQNFEYMLEADLSETQWFEHTQWKWCEAPPTYRCSTFLSVWKKLRYLPYEEINNQLLKIQEWAGGESNTDRVPMNEEQIKDLSKNHLYSFGMHTNTHPDLGALTKQVQADEILLCKKMLAQQYNIACNILAYPYGSYNNNTVSLVKQLKLTACFTTEAVAVYPGADLARLGRYQVNNCNKEVFAADLAGWRKKPPA